MAEQGALARGQQRGQELPFLGEQFWRHRRVHARVDAMQSARAHRARDDRVTDAGRQQLRSGDYSLLLTRDYANCIG